MDKSKEKTIYVTNDLHKRMKIYCIRHGIKSMRDFVTPFLEAAIAKPNAKERLERQAAELTEEERQMIDDEMRQAKSGRNQVME